MQTSDFGRRRARVAGDARRNGRAGDRRLRTALELAAGAAVLLAAFAIAALNVAAAPRHRELQPEATQTPVFKPRGVEVTAVPIPTPVFATYRSMPLYLPVKPKQITLISFHQAAGGRVSLHMSSLVPLTKLSEVTATPVASKADPGPDESAEIAAAEDEHLSGPQVYEGRVIRLWRTGRTGEPDTAVDVGAKPGTPVMAPVSGVVTVVHPYLLYGEYDDYEIHIRPDGWDQVDCVVLHVNDPKVRAGDRVVGGVTPLAGVRWLSRYFASQLDEYTRDGGNHVHVQLNQAPKEGAVQLIGGEQEDRPGTAGL